MSEIVSAKDFINVFKTVKILSQTKKRKYLKVTKKVEFVDDGRLISLEPNDSSLEVEFELNYENKKFIIKYNNFK